MFFKKFSENKKRAKYFSRVFIFTGLKNL